MKHRIYQDLASGRHDERPGLAACLKALQPGNTLIVWKLDRLGRNFKAFLITIMDELSKKQVGFKVLSGQGVDMDTTTSHLAAWYLIYLGLWLNLNENL